MLIDLSHSKNIIKWTFWEDILRMVSPTRYTFVSPPVAKLEDGMQSMQSNFNLQIGIRKVAQVTLV